MLKSLVMDSDEADELISIIIIPEERIRKSRAPKKNRLGCGSCEKAIEHVPKPPIHVPEEVRGCRI